MLNHHLNEMSLLDHCPLRVLFTCFCFYQDTRIVERVDFKYCKYIRRIFYKMNCIITIPLWYEYDSTSTVLVHSIYEYVMLTYVMLPYYCTIYS